MRILKAFQCQKGQALVETALVMPIIILLLMGIIDFGLMFNNYLMVSNVSREAARSAAIGATDVEIDALVDTMSGTLDPSKLTITISPIQSERKKGDEVVVTAEYDYNLITPLIKALVSEPIHLIGKTAMRFE
jgi:Flp pilus assembly protein TadG